MSTTMDGDILFQFGVNDGFADIILADSGRDLKPDLGLENAVLISYFTNLRIDDERQLPDIKDKGGWWGNRTTDTPMGSKLWLLRRGKLTNETPTLWEQYSKESLQWMIDDEVAETVDVTVTRPDLYTLISETQVYSPVITESGRFTYRYFFNWENQIIKRG